MFKLVINEPETNKKMDFDIPINQCFLEEELQGGVDLKNLSHLKKMAKILVEERVIIKRAAQEHESVDDGEISKDSRGKNSSNLNLYTVEINLSHITPINASASSERPDSTEQRSIKSNVLLNNIVEPQYSLSQSAKNI